MSTSRKPDLDQLIAALTADAGPDELAGRDAALAAFRAAGRPGAPGRATEPGRGAPFRWPLTVLSGRLAALAAAGVIAVAGIAAAAYARALPGPVQEAAHTVFAPLGVPDGPPQPGQRGHPSAVTIATPGGKSRPDGPSARAPSPRPAGDYRLTLTATRVRVTAGSVVELGGRVTDHGRAAAGTRVRLFERLAGSATWDLVATGVTGPRGVFRLPSPPLTATAVFRVAGPDGTHSAPVRVTVVGGRLRVGAADGVPRPAATGR